MNKKDTNLFSENAFKNFLYSLLILITMIFLVGLGNDQLKFDSKLIGILSGLLFILFLVFNFKGSKNSFKSIKFKEENSLKKVVAAIGNFVFSIFPISLILLVILSLLGVDVFRIMAAIVNE